MDVCVSETISESVSDSVDLIAETTSDLIAGHPFFGKKRLRKGTFSEDEASSEACLNYRVWSKLPEELLIHIFARLPVRNILQIRSLSKSWRSTITSSQFQHAFADASPVRIALMVCDVVDGTTFLTQENKEECFRFDVARCVEVVLNTNIVATAGGLVCVVENEGRHPGSIVGVRVFVMNLVTGVRRELPPPSVMTSLPTLVRMDTNVMEGGYSIMFIYTKDLAALEVSSWEVYNSTNNMWSKDDMGAMARLKDFEVFNMHHGGSYYFYDNLATFHKRTRAINVFNLHASSVNSIYIADRHGHAHNISGELYKLCKREERHGAWNLTCRNRWEMVCEIPEVEGIWTCLRVINDWVVLICKIPHEIGGRCTTGIVKVFHVPTQSWHKFAETECWGCHLTESFDDPFLVEVKFDAVP